MKTIYECTKCHEHDSDRGSIATVPPPAALICWKCKAGARMSVQDQVINQVGMLPIATEE